MACPLHIIQDSDLGVREALQIMSRNHGGNDEEDEGIQSENYEETGLAFQGPFCDCQVYNITISNNIEECYHLFCLVFNDISEYY